MPLIRPSGKGKKTQPQTPQRQFDSAKKFLLGREVSRQYRCANPGLIEVEANRNTCVATRGEIVPDYVARIRGSGDRCQA